MVNFKFKNVLVVYKGKGYLCSGSGEAGVSVDGYYHYSEGRMWDCNGDPGYPDEVDADIYSVELEELGDLEIDDIEAAEEGGNYGLPTEEELDKVLEDEEFYDFLNENLDEDDLEYDEDDLYDILREQAENDGPDFDDYYD